MALVANLKSKLIGSNSQNLDLVTWVYCSIGPIYSGNLAKFSSSKLFLNVYFNFLFESLHLDFCSSSYGIFTITGQISHFPEFLDKFGFGSFSVLTLANNSNGLWLEFEFLFFIKIVLYCLIFPWIQKSGHLDLSTQSYGHLNKHYLFDYFPDPELGYADLGKF